MMSTDTFRYSASRSTRLTAFTLLELLVVMAIIALLLTLLATGLVRVRHGAKSIKCMANLRVAAIDFQIFSDAAFAEDRGRSNRCPDGVFYFEDFVEKQYKVDEFWEQPERKAHTMQPSVSQMICPAAEQKLIRYPDRPCNDGALQPFENVSYAFNRRLYAETIIFDGRMVFNPKTKVSSRILQYPTVPLAFDGDGEQAQRRNRRPYFSAPPVRGHEDLYSGGVWWFPSSRHLGKTNVIFVGGHAQTSTDPAHETAWAWKYQPTPLP